MQIPFYSQSIVAAALSIAAVALPGFAVASSPITSSVAWPGNLTARFVTSLTRDDRGRIWAGCEESGVWRFDPYAADPAKGWTQFTTADGIGDNNGYAIVCDHQGRIWVGTLNDGVSVYNGRSWKTYDQVTGPLGGHVTAMAVAPRSGDVWIASEVGLARCRPASGDWKYYVAPAGISLSNATGLTFDRAGDILVGLPADGIAIGSALSDFQSWGRKTISATGAAAISGRTGAGATACAAGSSGYGRTTRACCTIP